MRRVVDAGWAKQRFTWLKGGSLRGAVTALAFAAAAAATMNGANAAPPASNEIRIGITAPFTGPASAYGVIAKVMVAYMDKINAEGGINGRKINMITYDDAYEPTKAMEVTRKLVEEDQVLFTHGRPSARTPTRRSSPI